MENFQKKKFLKKIKKRKFYDKKKIQGNNNGNFVEIFVTNNNIDI